MPTLTEYAQLANRVYARTQNNRTPVPSGWTEIIRGQALPFAYQGRGKRQGLTSVSLSA